MGNRPGQAELFQFIADAKAMGSATASTHRAAITTSAVAWGE